MNQEEAIVAEYLLKEKQYNYQSPPIYMGTPEEWLINRIKEVALEADNAAYRRGFDSGHDNAARNIIESNREAEGSDVQSE